MNLFKKLILILYPLMALRFWSYVGFNRQIVTALLLISVIGLFTLSYRYLIVPIFSYRSFYGITRLYLLNVFLSILMSLFIWGQNPLYSVVISLPFFSVFYFFLLTKWSASIRFTENVIVLYAFLFIVMWSIGMYNAPDEIFHTNDYEEINDNRGLFRIRLDGLSFVIFSFFMMLNRFMKSRRLLWLVMTLIFLGGIILQLSRQAIIISILISIFYIASNYIKQFVVTIVLILLIAPFAYKATQDTFLMDMYELSEDQLYEQRRGNEDIRVTEYKYFFTEFNKSVLGVFFGNGNAHSYSDYGKFIVRLANQKGLFPSDVGYAHVFVTFGLMGGLIFFFYVKRGLSANIPTSHTYLKLFMVYIILSNIASSYYMKEILPFIMCVYLIMVKERMAKHANHFSLVND